jgi:hypothetical protein
MCASAKFSAGEMSALFRLAANSFTDLAFSALSWAGEEPYPYAEDRLAWWDGYSSVGSS